MTSTRPTWAEISRTRLIHNHDVLRRLAGSETELLAVVKANAYGHGLAECARVLERNGARWFGVTSVEEGVALRRVCPEARILIMSGIWAGEAETAVEQNLTAVVWSHSIWTGWRKLRGDAVWRGDDSGASGDRYGNVAAGRCGPRGDGPHGADAAWVALRLEAVMTHFHSPDDGRARAVRLDSLWRRLWPWRCASRGGIFVSAGSSANLLLTTTQPHCQVWRSS